MSRTAGPEPPPEPDEGYYDELEDVIVGYSLVALVYISVLGLLSMIHEIVRLQILAGNL